MTTLSNIAVAGLAVIKEDFVLNMESKGFSVSVFNRTNFKVGDLVSGWGAGTNIQGCRSVKELVDSLERPRKVMMMLKAGSAVDDLTPPELMRNSG